MNFIYNKKLILLLSISRLIFAELNLVLTERQICDLELLMVGGYKPLNNFMNYADYNLVLTGMHLENGEVFPLPIVLDVNEKTKLALDKDSSSLLVLKDQEGFTLAKLKVTEIWAPDKSVEADLVYGTNNIEHPGVSYLMKKTGEYYVSGDLEFCMHPKYYDFNNLRLTPKDLKEHFAKLGIGKIVAFQTRNPMHRAHKELVSRAAQQIGAHALIHPVVGPTKPGDVDYVTRVRCYKHIINQFDTADATLALLPYSMRMAGPREAVMHAIIRKNYGATHFIVGRDHAGPGKDSLGIPFYTPYAAQELAKEVEKEIGIEIVLFQEMVYVQNKNIYKQVNELESDDIAMSISGTELREILENGSEIPDWFTYQDVALELRKVYPDKKNQGITIFFTGLSSSGKSTLANALAQRLASIQDRRITLLDGDKVRHYLSSELGFSKEHRSLNVRRVGFVSSEITKNGGIAICALIAPYEQDRLHNRQIIGANGGYLEVFVSTSLEECERRDVKGLYKLARAGKIPQFTGISDPYETPSKAEIVIDAATVSVEEAVDLIIQELKNNLFII